MNNPFLDMNPDPFHPALGWIVVIRHQETPGGFTVVESALKGNLSLWQETNMRMKDHP